ncbi:MAG TPA: hypothetical protein PLH20_11215 [Flavobacterium sp.]|jgi:hypothetical protein|uniref:hypothetical protein n=1 Tax=Flavobacterium sp. TaxID=239 RepID=UPI001B44D738|nr:hypothetical protein [Flavobacterium sp.]MBP7183745.1 hypothetical protein [Flavobacterium sp.]MBP7318832.1 hypothetical protein [Flavobacterium sp.]MBP8887340.1 hypothetical protein [Flavobacterium sp.]HRL72426.1 hypothetical protein [Flavobacterium sp.]HRM46564.1 hypothetical protein [Flavobacterium sp.]
MRKYLMVFALFFMQGIVAQELFVVTDPASNVPAGSLGIRLGQSVFKKQMKSGYSYHVMPEVAWGINKNLMVRTSMFVSNSNNQLVAEGASFYTKYRFLSTDDLQSHFRMAAYGRYSFNNATIHQEQIEIMGQNSGFETGIVATQLIKKLAVSASVSYEKAFDNKPDYRFPVAQSDNAMNYTLSLGRLMYPKKYTNFKQTNINTMIEFVGQTLNENGKSYLDIVPSVQFIINSQARIDFAYKHELYSSMLRSAPNGFYLNLEYNFFNVTK